MAKLRKFNNPKSENGTVTLAIQHARALLSVASKDATRENLKHIMLTKGPDDRPWLAATDGKCALYVQCEAAEHSALLYPVLMVADVLGAIASAKASKQDIIAVEVKNNEATTPPIWQVYPTDDDDKCASPVGIDPALLSGLCGAMAQCSNGNGVTMRFREPVDAITIESVCGLARALIMPMRIK